MKYCFWAAGVTVFSIETICKTLQSSNWFSLILTSAAGWFCRVAGVTVEEAADPPGLLEDWRSRQEPFPKQEEQTENEKNVCLTPGKG